MNKIVSDEYAALIEKIPGKACDMGEVFAIFAEQAKKIMPSYNILFVKLKVIEPPVRGKGEMRPTEVEHILYDSGDNKPTHSHVEQFEMGNGGCCTVIAGMDIESEWTEENKRGFFLFSKTLFLLLGRARVFNDLGEVIFVDQLTGIPNGNGHGRTMGRLMQTRTFSQYCSNFVNVKNMKIINNRFDDRFGDKAIIIYAQKLAEIVGEDGFVARLGGDNFIALVKKEKEEEFCDRIKKVQISLPMNSGNSVDITLESRVGIYEVNENDDANTVMNNSDIAMRNAKNVKNPDILKFEPYMKAEMLRMKELEQNLPEAISNEEFVVYLQPKADISDTEGYQLNGAEALVRWKKDDIMIPPGDFIPLLEKNGMVTQIDFYVFEHVCKSIIRWQEMGLEPVRVSSNFSRRHLVDDYFIEKIIATINKYNVDPKYLEIEITESYDNEDMEILGRFEQVMHDKGVKLAVDDFGSGFSSLKMVKNISSDVIKLDKSIIDGIGDNNGDDVIIRHIIKMVSELGKEVIAEGVEDEKQVNFLRENGCNNIQGFLYARPLPEEEFIKLLKKRNN